MTRGGKRKGAGRPRVAGRKVRQLSLDEETNRKLDALALDRGTNASAVVRELVDEAYRVIAGEET
jgi:hypothetical protein